MNRKILIFALFAFFIISFTFSQSLVELSKRNKELEKKSKPTRVITNADLKRLKGGSLAIQKGTSTATSSQKASEEMSPEEKAAFNRIYQLAGTLYAHEAEKKIKNLQLKKLRKLYFSSDNGVYRDNVIKPKMQKVYQDIKMLEMKIMEDKDSLQAARREEIRKGIDPYILNEAERKAKEEVEKNYKKEEAKYITTPKKGKFTQGSMGNTSGNKLKDRMSVFDKLGNPNKGSGRLSPAQKLKLKQGKKKNQ